MANRLEARIFKYKALLDKQLHLIDELILLKHAGRGRIYELYAPVLFKELEFEMVRTQNLITPVLIDIARSRKVNYQVHPLQDFFTLDEDDEDDDDDNDNGSESNLN